jgi:hypothetical protein
MISAVSAQIGFYCCPLVVAGLPMPGGEGFWKSGLLDAKKRNEGRKEEASALFIWLISHQPVVLFSENIPTTSNQTAVLFSQNKSAPSTSQTNGL